MTDLTDIVQAGYRGDMEQRPPYLSSPNGCGYIAGMAHRLAGGQFPTRASMGRGCRVNVGSRVYHTDGPECAEARRVIVASQWATAEGGVA
jgi:hypothetical protein